MKAAALLLGMILTAPLFASSNIGLSYQDRFEVKKVVLDEQLLMELYELPKNSFFEGERMIAGQFETPKKKQKKSYLESLRSKLNGSQISRF